MAEIGMCRAIGCLYNHNGFCSLEDSVYLDRNGTCMNNQPKEDPEEKEGVKGG